MPVLFNIIEDGHVVHYHYEQPWVYSDMARAMEEDRVYRDEIQRTSPGSKVHVLITMANLGPIPSGALRGRQSASFTHPTSGYVAIVPTSTQIRTVANAALQLAHFGRARFFDSLESAFAYLHEIIAHEQTPDLQSVR
ncbi:MAG: hypothetical protein ABI947_23255 [Chloroflexota bacterium]